MDDLTQFRRKVVQLGQVREQTRSQGAIIGKGRAGYPIGKGGGVPGHLVIIMRLRSKVVTDDRRECA